MLVVGDAHGSRCRPYSETSDHRTFRGYGVHRVQERLSFTSNDNNNIIMISILLKMIDSAKRLR